MSQIFVCRRFGANAPYLEGGLRSQGVELFGRSAALYRIAFHLPLTKHMHQFNANKGCLS